MKRRLICLALCLMFVLSVGLTGCKEKTTEEMMQNILDQASEDTVTLTMWMVTEQPLTDAVKESVNGAVNRLTTSKYNTYVVINFLTEDEYYATISEEILQNENARNDFAPVKQVSSAPIIYGYGDEDDKTDEEKDEDKEEVLVVRNEGDMTVIVSKSGSGENETINGYYVLRFGSVSDNTFNLKNVRHLLVAYEGGKTDSTTGKKTYTEAEKKAAKEAAEKLLAEFEKTGKTEADFEKLAKEHSDDTGSKEKGGLYEDIYPGQMVTEFEDWCYDEERKVGDYDLVQTDYGYHIMYYVGESEVNYRDFMIENDVRSETMTKWMEDLLKKAVMTLGTLKYVNRELVLSQG